MKLKIGSAQLLSIILIQLVFINAFLIICFLKKINSNTTVAVTNNEASISKSDSVSPQSINTERQQKENEETTNLKNKSKEFSFLQDFLIRFGLDKPKIRDFRIVGKQINQKSFIATAYDLSYESCGKYPSHREYGITFSGKPAVKGRTVAVDPEVIPLGSRIYIEFPKEYTYMNGWYIAEDTGSKVKGNIIDVYFGESEPYKTKRFGRRMVKVQIISPNGNKE